MAIANDVLTNRTDKKINYGVSRTDYNINRDVVSEAIASPLPNPSHNLWINSDLIPNAEDGNDPPTTNTANIKIYKYNASSSSVEGVIELTPDQEVLSTRTWLCMSTPGDLTTTRLKDWIRISYGGGYLTQFVVGPRSYGGGSGLGNGNHNLIGVSGYTMIFPTQNGYEFYFDTEAGVLVFAGTSIPANVTDSDYSVYMVNGFRYVGVQGFKNADWNSVIDTSTISVPSIRVGEYNDSVSDVSVANVSSILFNVDSGFALTDLANGSVTVSMESTFKNWNVFANTDTAVSSDIIAQAVDTISLYGGNGIILTANTGGIKSLSIDVDQGSLTLQGNTSADLLNWDNFTNTPNWSANSTFLHYSDLDGDSASTIIKDLNVVSTRVDNGTEALDDRSILKYNTANTTWSVSDGVFDLPHLNDVLIQSPQHTQVLKYVVTGGSGVWKNQVVDYTDITNRPTHTSNLTNDGIGSGSTFVTATGLINTIKLGDLANVANGASEPVANGYFLSYLTDTDAWTPVDVGAITSSAIETLDGNAILNLLTPVDGAGSSLDSDKLDGQQGTYYTTGSNINYNGTDISLGAGDLISATGKISVGNTTPLVPLQVEDWTMDTITVTVAGITTAVIDEWDATKFRAAKYFLTVTDLDTNDDGSGTDPSYLAIEAMVLHNGSDANITVYGEVSAGIGAVTEAYFSTQYDNLNNKCRLNVTTTTENCTIKASRMALTS